MSKEMPNYAFAAKLCALGTIVAVLGAAITSIIAGQPVWPLFTLAFVTFILSLIFFQQSKGATPGQPTEG